MATDEARCSNETILSVVSRDRPAKAYDRTRINHAELEGPGEQQPGLKHAKSAYCTPPVSRVFDLCIADLLSGRAKCNTPTPCAAGLVSDSVLDTE
ncbi:unnamed protein product [Parajaminaea phylloscopi]